MIEERWLACRRRVNNEKNKGWHAKPRIKFVGLSLAYFRHAKWMKIRQLLVVVSLGQVICICLHFVLFELQINTVTLWQ